MCPYPPVPLLDQRISCSFSIKRRVKQAFIEKCEELGISRSRAVEIMMEEFIRDN